MYSVIEIPLKIQGCDLLLIAPNHEPEFEFGAFKNGTHPTGSVICNVIGAFKNGAHLRRGGFASQILLSPDLTYRGLLVNMVLIVGQELFGVDNL